MDIIEHKRTSLLMNAGSVRQSAFCFHNAVLLLMQVCVCVCRSLPYEILKAEAASILVTEMAKRAG
jgi:hypothetical protein